jgi:hypothetical protein
MSDEMPTQPDTERQWLVHADHTASRDFDKAIMTLAAGALGVSIAFVRDFAPHPRHVAWLGAAWVCFALSLLLILISFLASQLALRDEVRWIDRGRKENGYPGGCAGKATVGLNWSSAAGLILGVVCLVAFALYNVKGGGT